MAAFTPPRSMGIAHSLTDISHTDLGNCAMISDASPLPRQPQSQASTLALGLPRCTPSAITRLTSAMISASVRFLQCGHDFQP